MWIRWSPLSPELNVGILGLGVFCFLLAGGNNASEGTVDGIEFASESTFLGLCVLCVVCVLFVVFCCGCPRAP